MTATLEASVQELKRTVSENDGRNAAGLPFCREVDRLIGVFYDDIGSIVTVSVRTLFDLFVIKVLYVERRSRDASVVDYLGGMLSRYLYTQELFPLADVREVEGLPLPLDVLQEMSRGPVRFQNLFEAYRRYADNALFISGVFPRSFRRRRRGAMGGSALLDRDYFVSTGKTCYQLAADHDLAEFTRQRPTLLKLSGFFEIYVDALNDLSERYVTGFDLNLIADKMLDSLNLYRESGEERHLENARRYAAILKLDEVRFPALLRRPRGHILG